MIKSALDLFLRSARLKEAAEALAEGKTLLAEELWDAPIALLSTLAAQVTGKHLLILSGVSQDESRLFHDFPYFSNLPVSEFPAWETLPGENVPPSPDIVGERYRILHQVATSKTPQIIISNLQACLQKLIAPKQFDSLYLELRKGSGASFDTLIDQLMAMGYQRRPVASDKGEFAVRGGLIDVYPVSSPDPFRLEFWGDEIESIRTYDPIGQKSVAEVDQIEVTPAQELEFLRETTELTTIIDYLNGNVVVVFDDLLELEDRYAALMSLYDTPSPLFSTIDDFFTLLKPLQKIYVSSSPLEELSEVRMLDKGGKGYYSADAPMHRIAFHMFGQKQEAWRWANPFYPINGEQLKGDEFLTQLLQGLDASTELIVLSGSEAEESALQNRLKSLQLPMPSQTHFQRAYLSSGFSLPDIQTMVLPSTELTQRYKIRRQKMRSTYHTPPSEAYDLQPGDTVVHINSGIGKFLGLERRPNHVGVDTEFYLLEYAENARLYVPLNQSHLVSKYVGAHEESPKLHQLGGNRWKRTKEQTQRAILTYANDLLQLYAQREVKGGFSYPEDSHDVTSFEEEFPFTETEDQLRAVAEIKQDMLSTKAMDRLICGDVGYGKTEVAMRAAFKAVVDGGKQVAVLVPTTVLAMQHYDNFRDRMRSFPVRIGVLSRFQSAKEIRETLKGIAEGSIDILIGTHRIVSRDVIFRQLGLVIVDEEQRFGVRAKEHLKKIKTGVDCLTMTATPIPRTLYMSLIGVRDMSVINTPPQDRLPIKTILAESNDETLRQALLRELARDGQAFIIHNRVETIFEFAAKIKLLLPQARVLVGHGQMHSDEIDEVFHAFKSGHADILVSTTIIENGIDIPNANTILIDRADRFGLAELYQLRGRVGRWNRRAYSYFLVPRLRSLPELSLKRLSALQEAGGYGGGMKIAMRDLEIRGAGNILGMEQSGHVAAIGFHLYCKLLKRTIQALQGQAPSILSDTRIDLPVDARLPEDYVNEVSLRMELYQRLGEALSWEDVEEIWKEIRDRFGPPPEPVKWLHHLTRLRVFAARNGFSLIKMEKLSLTAERQLGDKTLSKKILMKLPHLPGEMESQVIKALKKEFQL